MSDLIRSGFRVPPRHKPPAVEVILGHAVELLRIQSLQVAALIRCVGQDKFDAAVQEMAAEKPPDNPPEAA